MKLMKKIWNINTGNIIAIDWNHLNRIKYKGEMRNEKTQSLPAKFKLAV